MGNQLKNMNCKHHHDAHDDFQKRIKLDLYNNPHVHGWIYMRRGEINISGMKMCLPISDLIANYNNDDRITGCVDQYINQYCADTLISISQAKLQTVSPVADYQKPFKCEKIDITSYLFVD